MVSLLLFLSPANCYLHKSLMICSIPKSVMYFPAPNPPRNSHVIQSKMWSPYPWPSRFTIVCPCWFLWLHLGSLSSYSLCSNCTYLFVPWPCKAGFCLKAFTLAIPSVWNTLPSVLLMADCIMLYRVQLSCQVFKGCFLSRAFVFLSPCHLGILSNV